MDTELSLDEIFKKKSQSFLEIEKTRRYALVLFIIFTMGSVVGLAALIFIILIQLGVPIYNFFPINYIPDPTLTPLLLIGSLLAIGTNDVFTNKAHKKIVPLLVSTLGDYNYFRSIDDTRKIDGEMIGYILDRAGSIPTSDKENSILNVMLNKKGKGGLIICSPQLSRVVDIMSPRVVFASTTLHEKSLPDMIVTSAGYNLEEYKDQAAVGHIKRPYKLFFAQKNMREVAVDGYVDRIYDYVFEKFRSYEFSISFHDRRCSLVIKVCKAPEFVSLFRSCTQKDRYADALFFYQRLIKCMEFIRSRDSDLLPVN